MVAAGDEHTVLLRSDGAAVACGRNGYQQCDLPALGEGLAYVQVAAGGAHTVLLRSDGAAVACGSNQYQQRDLPALGEGLAYVQVAAGGVHTVLLRSDGAAVACGINQYQQCDLPALGEGLAYVQVAAGGVHTVLLRSDGAAVACGINQYQQCDLPALGEGLAYVQVAAGGVHTVLLRSDGAAVACGINQYQQCDLPALGEGLQCDLPALGEGLAYVQVAAGGVHTVLLRSDGAAVACGWNVFQQCDLPALRTRWAHWLRWQPCLRYVACRHWPPRALPAPDASPSALFRVPESIDLAAANELQAAVRRRAMALCGNDLRAYYPKIVLSYATGSRGGCDGQGAGPGVVHVSALMHALFDADLPCYSGLTLPVGRNWEVSNAVG
ncbi:unnamed protein product [Prorocentrum cordatum]|uniref:Uncharacterized protein n=1 Tax=Prorocentrum cordatum TaxID=2364126 RepID=A0ABN9XUS3_9DINO|nr:unnamed protein product [Polarella glacialis]